MLGTPPATAAAAAAPAGGHDLQVCEGVLVAQGLVLLQDVLGLREGLDIKCQP